jgi:hypothetical protein
MADGAAMPVSARYTFAWTPSGSGSLGSIMLRRKPEGRLTAATYWNALGERIDRMIAAEDPSEASRILDLVWRNEPAAIGSRVADAGSVMAEWSEWLRDRVRFPRGGVAPGDLIHEPETLAHLLSGEDRLEDYVATLYHDPDVT